MIEVQINNNKHRNNIIIELAESSDMKINKGSVLDLENRDCVIK